MASAKNNMAQNNLWKACLAGAAGGLLASYAIGKVHTTLEKAVGASPPPGEDSTVKVASAFSRLVRHSDLDRQEKGIASSIVHYGFGTSVAVAYGAAAEFVPALRTGFGTLFGLALWLGAHVIAVPALGLAEPITHSSFGEEAAEFGAHIAYGTVVELVRTALMAASRTGATEPAESRIYA